MSEPRFDTVVRFWFKRHFSCKIYWRQFCYFPLLGTCNLPISWAYVTGTNYLVCESQYVCFNRQRKCQQLYACFKTWGNRHTALTRGNVLRSIQQKGATIMKEYSDRHGLKTHTWTEENHLTTLYSAIHSMGIYSVLHGLLQKGKLNNSKRQW